MWAKLVTVCPAILFFKWNRTSLVQRVAVQDMCQGVAQAQGQDPGTKSFWYLMVHNTCCISEVLLYMGSRSAANCIGCLGKELKRSAA